jgi:hypothetical protein
MSDDDSEPELVDWDEDYSPSTVEVNSRTRGIAHVTDSVPGPFFADWNSPMHMATTEVELLPHAFYMPVHVDPETGLVVPADSDSDDSSDAAMPELETPTDSDSDDSSDAAMPLGVHADYECGDPYSWKYICQLYDMVDAIDTVAPAADLTL